MGKKQQKRPSASMQPELAQAMEQAEIRLAVVRRASRALGYLRAVEAAVLQGRIASTAVLSPEVDYLCDAVSHAVAACEAVIGLTARTPILHRHSAAAQEAGRAEAWSRFIDGRGSR